MDDNIKLVKAKSSHVKILNHFFKLLLEYERENYDNNIKDNLIINSYFNNRIDKDNYIILLGTYNEKIVGYIYAEVDNTNKIKKELEATINSIFVLEEYRNRGIGTKLLNEVYNILSKENVKYISISNLYYNEKAKRLYDKLGYKVFKEERRKKI